MNKPTKIAIDNMVRAIEGVEQVYLSDNSNIDLIHNGKVQCLTRILELRLEEVKPVIIKYFQGAQGAAGMLTGQCAVTQTSIVIDDVSVNAPTATISGMVDNEDGTLTVAFPKYVIESK